MGGIVLQGVEIERLSYPRIVGDGLEVLGQAQDFADAAVLFLAAEGGRREVGGVGLAAFGGGGRRRAEGDAGLHHLAQEGAAQVDGLPDRPGGLAQ